MHTRPSYLLLLAANAGQMLVPVALAACQMAVLFLGMGNWKKGGIAFDSINDSFPIET